MHIIAAGDICPGEVRFPGYCRQGNVVRNKPEQIFKGIAHLLADAHIVVGNLEGVLTADADSFVRKGKRFIGTPRFARILRQTGFTVLSIANNHTLEHGPGIFAETVKCVKSEGIEVIGLRGDGAYYSEPAIIHANGCSIALFGYNWVGKDNFKDADTLIAQSHDSVVNYTWNRSNDSNSISDIDQFNKRVCNDIRKANTEFDKVILCPHWGFEFIHRPPWGVVREARAFIEAGADLIIGSHPHVVQGFEQYKDTWVFYSLGNFVFDMPAKSSRLSSILEYSFAAKRHDTFSLVPVMQNARFQLKPAGFADKNRFDRIISSCNAAIGSDQASWILDDDTVYHQSEIEYSRRKIKNIFDHVITALRHPSMIRVIARKMLSFISLILSNLKGTKVRW